ncbi:MAG TPA: protein kinase [Polyangiaceae bacterium]
MVEGVRTTPPPPSTSPKARLLTRAQLVARLRHPNLVRMLPLPGGAGLAPVLNDARSLADFTLGGTFRRFELEQAVRLLLDVLSGLSALHEATFEGKPLVHGQVAPQHIYIGEHGSARLLPLVSAHLMPGARPESNGYVAPELLLGDVVDVRADLFSVGVMLWEALSGRRLFPDTSLDAVIATMVGGKVPPLAPPARARWAGPLCAVAARAISTKPAERYWSASELADAISVAGGRHLAESHGGDWQDEAPTPVFQPRRHLPALRAVTPPATVIDIPAPPALPTPSMAPMATTRPVAVEPMPAVDDVEVAAGDLHTRARRRRGWLVVVASIPVAAACWLMRAPAGPYLPELSLDSLQRAAAPAAAFATSLITKPPALSWPARASATAPATLDPTPASVPATAAAPAPVPATAAAPAPAPAPNASPTAAPSASAAPAASAPPPASSARPDASPAHGGRVPPRSGASPSVKPSDYGI